MIGYHTPYHINIFSYYGLKVYFKKLFHTTMDVLMHIDTPIVVSNKSLIILLFPKKIKILGKFPKNVLLHQ